MEAIVLKVAGVLIPPLLRLWHLVIDLWPSDPQRIRETVYDKKKERIRSLAADIERIKSEATTRGDDTVGDRQARPKGILTDSGNWHALWARVHWGHGSERRAFKSAWNYALAGECFSSAEDWEPAARMYHWGAHQFRELGSLGRAREYYCKAAENYRKKGDRGGVKRSANRAMGVCVLAGDEGGREEVRAEFEEFLGPSGQPKKS